MMDNDFLAEIADNPTDESTRLVYQDWLEEHGDERAEYLRLQTELMQFDPKDRKREKVRQKLRKLQGKLMHSWRDWLLSVSRAKIENCFERENRLWDAREEGKELTFEFECPQDWAKLSPVDDAADPTIRFCDQCRKHVYFCENIPEAENMADWGQCVAVDESLVRKNPDRIGTAGMVLGAVRVPPMPERLALLGNSPDGEE